MIKIIQIKSSIDLTTAFNIRTRVFVDEQDVPVEIEMDKYENVSDHFLCFIGEKAVGTSRMRKTVNGIKLERFAVLKEYRNKGVGKALVLYCLKMANNNQNIYLNAQENVISFYEKLGFIVAGERFFEANIPHKKMVFNLNPKLK